MKKVKSTTYALFAFFLGNLGIHKFYVNDKTTGFVYLVLSFTGIPGIIAFFTAIKTLLNTENGFVYLYENGSIIPKNSLPKNKLEIKLATDLKPGEKPFDQMFSFWAVLGLMIFIEFFVVSFIIIMIFSYFLFRHFPSY